MKVDKAREREREIQMVYKKGCVYSEKEGGGEKDREREGEKWYTKRGCVNSEKKGGVRRTQRERYGI